MPAIIDMSLVDSGILRAAMIIWCLFAQSRCAIVYSIIYFFISLGERCLCLLDHHTEACIFYFLLHSAAMTLHVAAVLYLFTFFLKKIVTQRSRKVCFSVEFVLFVHILYHHHLQSLFAQSAELVHCSRGEAESSLVVCHSTEDTAQPWPSATHEMQGRLSLYWIQ